MSDAQTALNIVNYWKGGEYADECQKMAKLQCLIIEAIENERWRIGRQLEEARSA